MPGCRCRGSCRCRRWSWAAGGECELADACVPVETAGRRIVFAYVPEAKAIGRIDGGHAVIAPAAVRVSLATGACEQGIFALAKVI